MRGEGGEQWDLVEDAFVRLVRIIYIIIVISYIIYTYILLFVRLVRIIATGSLVLRMALILSSACYRLLSRWGATLFFLLMRLIIILLDRICQLHDEEGNGTSGSDVGLHDGADNYYHEGILSMWSVRSVICMSTNDQNPIMNWNVGTKTWQKIKWCWFAEWCC